MYTGDKNFNHKKGVCADGVLSKPKAGSGPPPEWPQPQGIFSAGKFFDPGKFLSAVHDLYERAVDQNTRNTTTADRDYMLEDQAFSKMLSSRTAVIGDHAYFRVYDLEFVGGSFDSLITEIEPGSRYLRLDCI